MIKISPFRAVRPTRDKVHLVASRSYVSYTPAALSRKLTENPFSFIHIINPEFGNERKSRKNSPERFEKVREKYLSFLKDGILMQDEKDCFYLYEQKTPEAAFTGIICGVSTQDYREGRIKKHEQTLTSREALFCSYLDICGFNAEPVLLTYRENLAGLEALFASVKIERPEYEFTTTDRVLHRIWLIESNEDLKLIKDRLSKVSCLYIADGHHRMASSALLSEKRSAENPEHSGNEVYNYTMAMVMPGKNLQISPFHRFLSGDFGISDTELLEALESEYDISKCSECFLPSGKRQFGMRLKDGWYQLNLKSYPGGSDAYSHLDAVILTRTILEPVFKITDQKTDKRIRFVPGNKDLKKEVNAIKAGQGKALFTMFHVSSGELYAVSDQAQTMPPKSTFIEPKLRSGLTIMNLK